MHGEIVDRCGSLWIVDTALKNSCTYIIIQLYIYIYIYMYICSSKLYLLHICNIHKCISYIYIYIYITYVYYHCEIHGDPGREDGGGLAAVGT